MTLLRTATCTLLATLLWLGSAMPVYASPATSPTPIISRRGSSAGAPSSAKREPRIRKGRVLVRLKGATTATKLSGVYASADTSVGAVKVLRGETLSWRVPAGVSEVEFTERLEASGLVAYAEPDYTRQLAAVYTPPAYTAPNESAYYDSSIYGSAPYGKSWWLRDIKATSLWQQAYTGADVVGKYPLRADRDQIRVAVLDTGFWLKSPNAHPDGVANVVAGWDTYSNDADVTPPSPGTNASVFEVSHGTDVAGLIGAHVGNGIGSFGVAYDTRVVIYKVAGLDSDGELEIADSAVILAIDRAVAEGCKVINMSFVGPEDSDALRDAVDRAHDNGVILVAARGNNGNQQLLYPAAWPNVVGVSALAKNSSGATVRASFSNYGVGTDLSAPGDQIWGLTHPAYGTGPGYDWWNGTSMASPIVAGGLALLWRAAPDLSADEVVAIAQESATDLYADGWDSQSGWGELNLLAAYSALKTRYPLLAKPTIALPDAPSTRGVPITWTTVPGYEVRYDVSLDGVRIASGLSATSASLPAMTPGAHTVTVTPTSRRNWMDGTARASATFSALNAVPVILSLTFDGTSLRWTSTEPAGAGRSYILSIEDGPAIPLTAEKYDVTALAQGEHTATVSVLDGAHVQSEPRSLDFRVWPKPTVQRISGSDRYAANVELSRSAFTTATTVMLVSGGVWPDALSASPLARTLGGPVLLTARDSLPSATRWEIARLRASEVVIVGGPASVSDGVARSLDAIDGVTVRRLSGRTRYSTADEVARELHTRGGAGIEDGTALVASGETHHDALIAAAVGARKGWPVLLTAKTGVSAGTLATLRDIGVDNTIVIGSTSAVSAAALTQLPAPTRIGAAGSSASSVAVANWATATYPADFSGERFYVASTSSVAFADSLGVGAVAGRSGALLLLTPKTLASEVAAYYRAHPADAVTTYVVGGPNTLPNTLLQALKNLTEAP